jgi:hypothetical protein
MHATADTTIVKFPLGAGRRMMRGVRRFFFTKKEIDMERIMTVVSLAVSVAGFIAIFTSKEN